MNTLFLKVQGVFLVNVLLWIRIKMLFLRIKKGMMREDRSLLVLLHLSGLLTGFIIPLILWSSQREQIEGMDEHGKAAVNFQLSALLYLIFSFMMGFMCCIGFVTIPFWFVYAYLFPIISAVNVSKGKPAYYPLTIRFIV